MSILRDWDLSPILTDRNKPQPELPAPEPYIPALEVAAPADWFIRSEIAKAKLTGELDAIQPQQPWFTIENAD